jgi:hypothetical protein
MPNDFTHAYCDRCGEIQLVTRESLDGDDGLEVLKEETYCARFADQSS